MISDPLPCRMCGVHGQATPATHVLEGEMLQNYWLCDKHAAAWARILYNPNQRSRPYTDADKPNLRLLKENPA